MFDHRALHKRKDGWLHYFDLNRTNSGTQSASPYDANVPEMFVLGDNIGPVTAM